MSTSTNVDFSFRRQAAWCTVGGDATGSPVAVLEAAQRWAAFGSVAPDLGGAGVADSSTRRLVRGHGRTRSVETSGLGGSSATEAL
jgi:hypothetical protein